MTHQICMFCKRDADCDNRESCITKPQLNMGSGLMIKKECINFDFREYSHGGRYTDVLGDIRLINHIFEAGTFHQVLTFHVLEHFFKTEVLGILRQINTIMVKRGKLVVECPDVIGVFNLYWLKQKNITKLIDSLYGGEAKIYEEEGWHRYGWTAPLMAIEMEKAGFQITHQGIGMSHGMGARDFRVEALKL